MRHTVQITAPQSSNAVERDAHDLTGGKTSLLISPPNGGTIKQEIQPAGASRSAGVSPTRSNERDAEQAGGSSSGEGGAGVVAERRSLNATPALDGSEIVAS